MNEIESTQVHTSRNVHAVVVIVPWKQQELRQPVAEEHGMSTYNRQVAEIENTQSFYLSNEVTVKPMGKPRTQKQQQQQQGIITNHGFFLFHTDLTVLTF